MIAREPMQRWSRRIVGAVALSLLGVSHSAAQDTIAVGQDGATPRRAAPVTQFPDSAGARPGVSPGGAFLRAVLVPGWGHTSIGARTRAGFYFVLEATSGYGILRTRRRISEARARAGFRESVLRLELADRGVTEEADIQAALDDDAVLEDLTALTESRQKQQEDWAAMGIFLLFLSGADAYVSAHLKDFPTPIELEAAPAGNGRMDVGLKIPVGN